MKRLHEVLPRAGRRRGGGLSVRTDQLQFDHGLKPRDLSARQTLFFVPADVHIGDATDVQALSCDERPPIVSESVSQDIVRNHEASDEGGAFADLDGVRERSLVISTSVCGSRDGVCLSGRYR